MVEVSAAVKSDILNSQFSGFAGNSSTHQFAFLTLRNFLGGDILVPLAGCLRLLLETVQDVHGFLEFGDVHHPENAVGIANADFPRSCAHVIEWLPVVRFQANLDFTELESGIPARLLGEADEIVIGGPDPQDFLFAPGFVLQVSPPSYQLCIKFYTS